MKSVNYHGTRLEILLGDITQQDTDAIVNPANSQLSMGGGVALALKRVGGADIEREALRKAPVPIGQAVETNAGKLLARFIIHSPTMEVPATRTDSIAVRKATQAALILASKLKLRSMASPGMGTGVGGLESQTAATVMIDEIKRHIENGTSLKEIRLVCREQELLDAFDQAISKLTTK